MASKTLFQILYNASPKDYYHSFGKFIRGHKKKAMNREDFLYGWILDEDFFRRQDDKVTEIIHRLKSGAGLEACLTGFNGKEYGERVVEYPYFANWLLSKGKNKDLLDIGCVLNNQVVDEILNEHCRSVWFCNPAVEKLAISGNVYYHVAKLEEAFPLGEKFDLVTSLSTIEHIGFDNSQYGSTEKPKYDAPTIVPLNQSLSKITKLLRKNGSFLISVPYGYGEARTHRLTKKKAFQVFDFELVSAAISKLREDGIDVSYTVFSGNDTGWHVTDPESCRSLYANGFPYNTPQKLDSAIRLKLACHIKKETEYGEEYSEDPRQCI